MWVRKTKVIDQQCTGTVLTEQCIFNLQEEASKRQLEQQMLSQLEFSEGLSFLSLPIHPLSGPF